MIKKLRQIVSKVADARELETALRLVVSGVKDALLADACAVYLIDPSDERLVLGETEGLDRASIGVVRLAVGTGVVSLVREQREVVRSEEVSLHPRFKLFPVTGESQFRAFIGAPIIHRGDVIGVLAIWRKGYRSFDDRDEAFLATAAVQLSGALAGAIVTPASIRLGRSHSPGETYRQGIAGAPGVAIGEVMLPSPLADLSAVPDRRAIDITVEETAFLDAVASVQAQILQSSERMQDILPSESHALFEVYAMLAGDESLTSRVVERIHSGSWAPAALRDTVQELCLQFNEMADERLKERAEDIRAVGRKLLLALRTDQLTPKSFPKRTVLVGDEVSLARIAEVPQDQLAGIVCLKGSVLSHTVVIARSLGIPAVMGLGDISAEGLAGRHVIIDGYMGRVFIDPPPSIVSEYSRFESEERLLATELDNLSDLPTITSDGVRVVLDVNTGLASDIDSGLKVGAEGVGLYRSEFPFMLRQSFPTETEQCAIYRRMLAAFSPRPVVMRTLDIGGDKPLPYFPIDQTNSLLGWRGIRVMLQHPELFLVQLKAMLRANAQYGNLHLLLPMVSTTEEVRDSRAILEQAIDSLRREGIAVKRPPLGIMVEVPIVLFILESLAAEVDFLSVGSNDLTQYLTAVDRGNANVAHLYDPLAPGVLKALHSVVKQANDLSKPVSLCGDLAADPASALLLLGMGFVHLSMAAPMVPRVKKTLRSFSQRRASELFELALELPDGAAVRTMLNRVFEEEGIGGLVRAGR
ncbi:phosphoenolpyruvate--protein phosphotransferase [Haliea sp. E1-2-M8]|uniref:phosphoenolpyruvate--protein phosphotransferase n=1 Tax=Haliea sp. E1-2-M8 TaxID=3064706 RepID=UPI002726D2EC|nr:phosphoenolpyruvate--protein phosphotransferase [Haliea sp. E1-2-M8]MDO8864081.1 phosphoenolpyruvate--protein phosphotransferase [Haliea sp. E1-2-M8]